MLQWREEQLEQEQTIPWKEGGVYLISGGMGGLGILFAKEIIKHANNAKLILTGRSPLDKKKTKILKELHGNSSHVTYEQIDVTQKKDVVALINKIKQNYGSINGVIHSAGVSVNAFISTGYSVHI